MNFFTEQVNSMGPLIDQELERVDRKHAQLTQLSCDLVEALNLYHTLMKEPVAPQSYHTLPKQVNYGYPPSHVSTRPLLLRRPSIPLTAFSRNGF